MTTGTKRAARYDERTRQLAMKGNTLAHVVLMRVKALTTPEVWEMIVAAHSMRKAGEEICPDKADKPFEWDYEYLLEKVEKLEALLTRV